jgi:hypothetical protein
MAKAEEKQDEDGGQAPGTLVLAKVLDDLLHDAVSHARVLDKVIISPAIKVLGPHEHEGK